MRPNPGRFWLAALVIACALGQGSVRAGDLLAVAFDGTLYDVSTSTGASSNPRVTGLTNLVGVAASGGDLFALTSFGSTPEPDALYRLDPATGAATLVGSTGLIDIVEGDLAFDPRSGQLYGLQEVDPSVNRGLFRIDAATGTASVVGDVNAPNPLSDLSAMAFDAAGHLYVIDRTGSLLTVDPTTAQVLSSVDLNVGLGTTAGMAIDPVSGIAYVADGGTGGTDSLYRLNLTTGVLTLIGSTGASGGLAGLTFFGGGSPVVPEPTSLMSALVAASSLGAFISLRRRRCRMTA